MKVTFHAGRLGSANHNDRNYDYSSDYHIDKQKVQDNIYINAIPEKTFKELELDYYRKEFSSAIKKQNERNIKARKPNRNKTIEDVYRNKTTKPQEIILQIGNKKDPYKDVETFTNIVKDYIEQFNEEYGSNCKILDAAIHVDEANIHAHLRRVWFVETEDGKMISQRKALEELGIERPDLSAESSRMNNAQITLTNRERKAFINICKEYGVAIEKTNHKSNIKSISIWEKKEQLIQEHVNILRNELNELKEQKINLEKLSDILGKEEPELVLDLFSNASMYKEEFDRTNEQINKLQTDNKHLNEKLSYAQNELKLLRQQLDMYEELKKRNKKFKQIYEEEYKENYLCRNGIYLE